MEKKRVYYTYDGKLFNTIPKRSMKEMDKRLKKVGGKWLTKEGYQRLRAHQLGFPKTKQMFLEIENKFFEAVRDIDGETGNSNKLDEESKIAKAIFKKLSTLWKHEIVVELSNENKKVWTEIDFKDMVNWDDLVFTLDEDHKFDLHVNEDYELAKFDTRLAMAFNNFMTPFFKEYYGATGTLSPENVREMKERNGHMGVY